HPLVVASLQAETNLRDQLRNELGLSIQTLSKDRDIAGERVSKLNSQRYQLEARLENIARIRADYSNVASEVKSRNEQLQESERELVQAQASRDASLTSSLITRLDDPQLGEKPIGPGRSTILAGTTISGLFFGLGVVFLLAPLDGGANYGRRRFDYSGVAGRRAGDKGQLAGSQTENQTTLHSFSQRSDDSQCDAAQPMATGTTPTLVERRGAATVSTADFEVPNWAQPIKVTQNLAGVIEAWKNSQKPIQQPARPEPKSHPSEQSV
ncbi:MAG: hypothetical protein ABI557_21995, partial [Aureliella sp.]